MSRSPLHAAFVDTNAARLAPAAGAAALSVLVAVIYVRRRRPRWNAIIDESIAYHRYHLAAIGADRSVDEASRDLARQMQQIIVHQFMDERRTYRGLRSLAAWRRRGTALGSCQQVFYRLYRDRYFDPALAHEERLYRLLDTLVSTLFRFYAVNSLAAVPALVYCDLTAWLARRGLSRRGSHRLYADIGASLR